MVNPLGKLKYVFNFVFFKSFILMFQLGFELSYPRLDASIHPLPTPHPCAALLKSQIKTFLEKFHLQKTIRTMRRTSPPFCTLP